MITQYNSVAMHSLWYLLILKNVLMLRRRIFFLQNFRYTYFQYKYKQLSFYHVSLLCLPTKLGVK